MNHAKKIAVFLDRDGTLNEERGYLRKIEDLELISGAASALRKLNDAGILTILTTNQSGVARGFYNEDHIHGLHKRLADLLERTDAAQAWLDAVYFSPHHPRGAVTAYAIDSLDRKPGIGMIQKACAQFPEIDLPNSYVVGDKASDVEFGYNAGCKTILLKTGYGERVLAGKYQQLTYPPTFICETITQAVDTILTQQASQIS